MGSDPKRHPKRVAVLGSTGSIGRSALDVIAAHPTKLRLVGLAARSRIEALAQQTAAFRPSLIAVWDGAKAEELARTVNVRPLVGAAGLIEFVTHPDVDLVVVASSGQEVLVPLVRAIQTGKRIALASKELLVMAGELIMQLVREHGTTLVPVDSEHTALFQCLQGVESTAIERLIITGSGGPLWSWDAAALATATQEHVLAHPKWSMGPKITVDSATLMNKGLETIEAHWLFGVPYDRIQVRIHPEAAVHAVVDLCDGSSLAQLAPCDMRLPIQYALSFPERWKATLPRLQLTQLSGLRFFEPDLQRFPCLRLALNAAAAGSSACVVLNGANSIAVHAYLDGQIAFGEIARLIEAVLERHTPVPHPSLDDILAIDAWARQQATSHLPQWSHSLRRFAVGKPEC